MPPTSLHLRPIWLKHPKSVFLSRLYLLLYMFNSGVTLSRVPQTLKPVPLLEAMKRFNDLRETYYKTRTPVKDRRTLSGGTLPPRFVSRRTGVKGEGSHPGEVRQTDERKSLPPFRG